MVSSAVCRCETEPKAPKAPRAPETRIRDAAQDIIKVCENIESPTFRPAEVKALAEQIIRIYLTYRALRGAFYLR